MKSSKEILTKYLGEDIPEGLVEELDNFVSDERVSSLQELEKYIEPIENYENSKGLKIIIEPLFSMRVKVEKKLEGEFVNNATYH